jgi:hypothetical protein
LIDGATSSEFALTLFDSMEIVVVASTSSEIERLTLSGRQIIMIAGLGSSARANVSGQLAVFGNSV